MTITADMAGIVCETRVQPGDRVEAGQELLIIESMKMQIPVAAPAGGVVRHVHVKEGDFVNAGDVLVDLQED